ncbi:MAG: OmpH family outer membrane protein [Candidatus Aminicenantes bacterium]|nr:MAG: OmpH family outer membrane protein [Candidatus Aminicenantes bacterium]
MRRSSSKILLLTLFIAVVVSFSFAQQPNKIGVINSQEVLEKSAEGKKVIAQLEDRNKRNQDRLTRLDDDIRKLETELNTQRLTLTQEALLQKNSDLERRRTERKRLAEDLYREMNELQVRLFQRIQNELLPIIDQIGKEKGLDVIFDLAKSGAVYFDPAVNITADVIKRYDESKVPTKK